MSLDSSEIARGWTRCATELRRRSGVPDARPIRSGWWWRARPSRRMRFVPHTLAAHATSVRTTCRRRWRSKRELSDLKDIRWHLIGHLQTNKARVAAASFDIIESLDSVRLGAGPGAGASGAPIPVLIEVNLGDEASKTGVAPAGRRSVDPGRPRHGRGARADGDSAAGSGAEHAAPTSRGCGICAIGLPPPPDLR